MVTRDTQPRLPGLSGLPVVVTTERLSGATAIRGGRQSGTYLHVPRSHMAGMLGNACRNQEQLVLPDCLSFNKLGNYNGMFSIPHAPGSLV